MCQCRPKLTLHPGLKFQCVYKRLQPDCTNLNLLVVSVNSFRRRCVHSSLGTLTFTRRHRCDPALFLFVCLFVCLFCLLCVLLFFFFNLGSRTCMSGECYSYATCMLPVGTRILPVCYQHVLVGYSYAPVCHSYVTRVVYYVTRELVCFHCAPSSITVSFVRQITKYIKRSRTVLKSH